MSVIAFEIRDLRPPLLEIFFEQLLTAPMENSSITNPASICGYFKVFVKRYAQMVQDYKIMLALYF